LDVRLQERFYRLVAEHSHSVSLTVSGLSALPGTAKPFASTVAMSRFLNNEAITLPALMEPAQEAVRAAVAASPASVALVAHDWSMFNFSKHSGKADRWQRSHDADLGYDLGSALVIDAADGRPLGPMELRVRTAKGLLTTRPSGGNVFSAHVDELADVFAEARRWQLERPVVHIVDREADSVGHFRAWHRSNHRFLVRADAVRTVTWNGRAVLLSEVVTGLKNQWQMVLDPQGQPLVIVTAQGSGQLRVAEAAVVLDRPAKTMIDGKKTNVPGPALPLRLIVSQVIGAAGAVLSEWLLFSNVDASFDSATLGRWYAWRWRIESYHKLLKTAGLNAEQWQQECGEAFAKRLVIASMACLTVWHLQCDDSEAASEMKTILVRLSGRQMKRTVPYTAPALLAGLEKLLAVHDLLASYDLDRVLHLARIVLPTLFPHPPPDPHIKKM
jgi:hypothetical protein